MANILSIGLSQEYRDAITSIAATSNHEVFHVSNSRESVHALGIYACDLVIYLLKPNTPLQDELSLLSKLSGHPDVLALASKNDADLAEEAIRFGVWDIASIPFDTESLSVLINRCLQERSESVVERLDNITSTGLIGSSPALVKSLHQMYAVSQTDSTVLLLGETGTGKELFARAIHDNSLRRKNSFVVVDCTNLPTSLAESILFGHAKGAFTGAVESRPGLFLQADGGTIFLDELGELDLSVQKSLLRVLQEKKIRPLSSKSEISCDFRVVSATNKNLLEMIEKGEFRQDLYHRICNRTITIPPLRDRVDDIPAIAQHYLALFCSKMECQMKSISPEAMSALKLYNWPGNVRELINTVQTMVLNGVSRSILYPQHLPQEIRLFILQIGLEQQDLIDFANKHSDEASMLHMGSNDPSILGVNASPSSIGMFSPNSNQSKLLSQNSRSLLTKGLQEGRSNIFSPSKNELNTSINTDIPRITAHHEPTLIESKHPLVDTPATSLYTQEIHPHLSLHSAEMAPSQNLPPSQEYVGVDGAPLASGSKENRPTPLSLEEDTMSCTYSFKLGKDFPSFKEFKSDFSDRAEEIYMEKLMQIANGDIRKGMVLAKLSRARVYDLLRRHNIRY